MYRLADLAVFHPSFQQMLLPNLRSSTPSRLMLNGRKANPGMTLNLTSTKHNIYIYISDGTRTWDCHRRDLMVLGVY